VSTFIGDRKSDPVIMMLKIWMEEPENQVMMADMGRLLSGAMAISHAFLTCKSSLSSDFVVTEGLDVVLAACFELVVRFERVLVKPGGSTVLICGFVFLCGVRKMR
jgi:hypothetical protein